MFVFIILLEKDNIVLKIGENFSINKIMFFVLKFFNCGNRELYVYILVEFVEMCFIFV